MEERFVIGKLQIVPSILVPIITVPTLWVSEGLECHWFDSLSLPHKGKLALPEEKVASVGYRQLTIVRIRRFCLIAGNETDCGHPRVVSRLFVQVLLFLSYVFMQDNKALLPVFNC